MAYTSALCCCTGDLEELKVYLQKDVNMNNINPLLSIASGSGHIELVKLLIDEKADIATMENYPIRFASSSGHLNVVKFLVKSGANIQDMDNGAVWMASLNGHLKVVEFLLSKGADFNKLTPEHKEYFRMKRAYSRWRRVYLQKWIRKVLIPLYYSPKHRGGIQAKKELEMIF